MEGEKQTGTPALRGECSPPPKVVDFAFNGMTSNGADSQKVTTPEPQPSPFPTRLVVDDGLDEDEQHHAGGSDYAMSTYPKVQASHRVEYPYHKGHGDDATIDSARTLYAEAVEYDTENGRQYCGDYFMPIDQDEQTRQYVVHQVYLKAFNLELTTVPLDDPTYILDIGTGIGEWAIGMAEKYPDCEVFGTDIAPIQPTQQVPFNIEFHIENAEDEWIRPPDSVDLVHIREMAGAFADWEFVYQQAFNCIKPGGWIEVLDFDDFYSDKNFLSFYPPSSAAHVLMQGILQAAEAMGRSRGIEHLNPELLEEVGFEDIKQQVLDLGVGMRANPSYGNFWLVAILTGLEAYCLRPLTQGLGWDPNYVKELCDKVAQETKALAEDAMKSNGFATRVRVLTGRKPLGAGGPELGQWTSAKALNENGDIEGYSGGDDSTIGSRSANTLRSEGTI
ncbi:hypothetical protein OQA88_157 [Cercophora sp. LCS_1]